jgi:hypothetical protein
MIVAKNIVGSFIGTLIAVWFSRWLGWIPSYDCMAERYFVEHNKEIVLGLIAVGLALAVVGCLILLVYAMYRMARTIR